MDLSPLPFFDPSDKFEDIITSNDQSQSLEDCDGLPVALTYVDAIQNGPVNHLNGVWCSNMPMHVPTATVPTQRQPTIFDSAFVDDTAWRMMNDMQQTFPESEDFFDDIEPTTWVKNETSDDSDFPWGRHEYHEASSSNDVLARSPVDGIVQQSNPYNAVEIHYQPIAQPSLIPSPAYNFGPTQLAPYMFEIPVVSTSDCEPQSIKKRGKKRPNVSSSTPPPPPPPPSPDPPRMNEWYLRDENGRRRRPLLYEFLRLLLNNRNYSDIAEYVDKRNGIFKFYQRERAAQMWGLVKGRNGSSSKFHMNYQ
jgi:hypothetical protein